MGFGIPASCLGLIVSGDLAGQTIYTDRFGKKVWFNQAPPRKGPSDMQTTQRSRFRQALDSWADADPGQRATFEAISLRASLAMTGLNLWIHVALCHTTELLATLQGQTGLTVADPPLVP